MKRLLIILALIPLFGYGQINDNIFTSSGGGLIFNGELLYVNTLSLGARLSLPAQNISEDSLTFNSTADLVTYANADTVVLDGSTSVAIENYVRFGSPTSGTIYQILDTLGSSDTLILDQTFTGSVTDEFFWGGVNTWYDESGKGNDAIQSIAINQPKLLDDTASILCDGVNDYLRIPDTDNLSFGDGANDSPFSISVWVNPSEIKATTIIGKHTSDVSEREYKLYSLSSGELLFVLYDESINAFIGKRNLYLNPYLNQWVNIIVTYDGSGINGINIYIDNVLTTPNNLSSGAYVAMENLSVPVYIGGYSSNSYFSGKIDNIYVYSRVLTETERTILYQSSDHYTP